MNYKHGNWYCKPANEEEAKEIVERAVASGAERYETVIGNFQTDYENEYEWNDCDAWGVIDGRTWTGDTSPHGSFKHATEYTITRVRELFPLPGEQQTGWNGEGLPPVGAVCEGIYRGTWLQCEVLKHKVNMSGTKVAACDFGIDLAWSGRFRKLRTERERWVSEAQKHCTEFGSNQLGKLYDALKSGELKAPEVE